MNPLATVRAIAAVLALLVVFIGGRACGQISNSNALTDCAQRSANLKRSNDELSAALQAVNVQATEARAQAERQQQRAVEAVLAAQEAGADYARRLGELEGSLNQAKQDPSCRQMLEQKVCAVLQ